MFTPTQITHAAAPEWIVPEYATKDPFNEDRKRMVLVAVDHFILCDGDGNKIRDLTITASQRPKWDRADPDILYSISGNAFLTWDVRDASNLPLAVNRFDEYILEDADQVSGIDDLAEADICEDGDKCVFRGVRKDNGTAEVFVYSLKAGKVAAWPVPLNLRSLYITPSYVICGTLNGTFLFMHSGELRGQIIPGQVPHMDVHGDNLIYCSSNDPDFKHNDVVLMNLATKEKRSLMEIPWMYAYHISCCDQEFCLVSTYHRANQYPGELWKVNFDASFELLGGSGSMIRSYESQPHATLSRDGSRFVYGVDDGQTVNTWMAHVDATGSETRIDYSAYLGQEFNMRFRDGMKLTPRADGAVDVSGIADVFQRKAT